jgi:type VI protein secretion system component VasF
VLRVGTIVMTPQFASLVNPTFQCVLELVDRLERGDRPDFEAERNRIRYELEDAEKSVLAPDSRVKPEEFRLAKEALVYWADEVLTDAERDWEDFTLERAYFDSKDRAWKFYVVGETTARHSSPDVVETWYLALVLGFRGDIRNAFFEHMNRDQLPGQTTDPDEARVRWAGELARQIRQSQLGELPAPPLEGDVRPLRGRKLLRKALACLGAATLALVVLLIVWWRQ